MRSAESIVTGKLKKTIRLTGNSMFPSMIHGDMACLDDNIDEAAINDGDVLLVVTDLSGLKVHRYKKEMAGIKGDSSIYLDHEKFTILAKVTEVSPGPGRLWYKNKYKILHWLSLEVQFTIAMLKNDYKESIGDICFDDIDMNLLFEFIKKNKFIETLYPRLLECDKISRDFIQLCKNSISIDSGNLNIPESNFSEEAFCREAVNTFSNPVSFLNHVYRAYIIACCSQLDFERLIKLSEELKVKKRVWRMFILLDFLWKEPIIVRIVEQKYGRYQKRIFIAFYKHFFITNKGPLILRKLVEKYFRSEGIKQYVWKK